ncbi:MAG: two-component system, chemotaxis family, sensor kinase CheA [Sphingomonadales bacterium]|jgi:two-component system chemotaxis sensor kinase CheA|nr:two-component system, chemotaxis family, sensor kinase CheA [Sphingomonadales bacterium]
MDELLNDFIAETRDMAQALSGAIVAWEAAPGDRERLDEIFRFVHTVKGNSGFFDLPRLEQLSHAAEGALAEVRAGTRTADTALVNAVLAVIDRIGELVQALETGEPPASGDDAQLIDALSSAPVLEAVAEAAAPEPEARKSVRSIRLSVDLLDRMMSGVSDAVLARNELARRLRDAPRDVAVEAAFERVSACIAEIRDGITRTRMQRIDSLFSGLPRLVRDLSAELGKQVRLDVDGGDVELDREMIEMIRDPLTHIVRNAIDHGIESPEERAAAGKKAAGTLKVSARQAGNQILIEVADDGRGIDGEALVRTAKAAGLISAEHAERLGPAQKLALIFTPSLSTAERVTAISGRGVGMDVVRANIERIGGVVDIDSRPSQGVRLCIRVPLTLTIIPALTITAGGQVFAIPRSAIDEILRASSVRIDRVGEAEIATVRDRRLPLVALSALLGIDSATPRAEQKIVLLKPAGSRIYALAVEAVHDHEELVVKPAAPAVMAAGLYAGTTLADDGSPILLLDPSGMAKCAGIDFNESEIERALQGNAAEAEAARETSLLLFRGFDGCRRAVPVAVVERIEDVAAEAVSFGAGKLRVAIGERILPLAGCEAGPAEGKLRILRLTDGVAQIAYGFAEVIDIRSLVLELQPAPAPGEIAGVALIDGVQVELLDPHWLFAAHADAASSQAAPVCALPEGDPWVDNMLRPLIESLGYRIAGAGEGADVVIALDGDDAPADAHVVRIRASAEGESGIYRYDRAGLIGALSAAKGSAHG